MFVEYDFDPESDDFRKMFKTELWHGLWKVLQKFKTQKRDWKRLVQKDYSDLESRAASDSWASDPGDPDVGEEILSGKLTPFQRLETLEDISELDEFIDTLVHRLDDEARVLLSEILYPRSWDEIPQEYKTNGTEDEYWRVPKKIPQHVIARMLGWPLIRVRRALSRIRKQAAALGEEQGNPRIAAGIKKRKRRSNVESTT